MTTDPDYLSDEDAERMARAYHPGYWAMIDMCVKSLDADRRELAPKMIAEDIEAIQALWSARPESARRLDAYAINWGQRPTITAEDLMFTVAEDRARHLLKGSTKQKGAGK